MQLTSSSRQTPDLLARSAFGLLLIGVLVNLIVGIALLRAPVRPTVRTPMLIVYGVFFVVMLTALIGTLIAPLERFHALTGALIRVFGRPLLALILILPIILIAAVVVPIIDTVAPDLASLSLLLIVWGALIIVALGLCNARSVMDQFARTRSLWTGIGVVISFGLIVIAIFFAVNEILASTHLLDQLRGASDYRDLIFYGNQTNPQQSQAYWTELGNLQTIWDSYVYTRFQEFHGQYINIDSEGRRATASFVKDRDKVPNVYFFGGSTMWGEGSRDDYTIPSQVARQLSQAGTPIRATNYGQVAWVSTQDMITFERQLALGNVPQVAVFYGGFNDIAAQYIDNQIAGLPQNEVNRQSDLVAGQILRDDGRPLLSYPSANLANMDFSLMGIPNASPAQIADLYVENMREIRAVAHAYGVKTLFVWQPAIVFKQSLTPEEQSFVTANDATWPDFETTYRAADQEFRRRVQADKLSDVLILSDLFAKETRYLFFDRVHVIEDGNTLIANAILPSLTPLLKTS